MSSIINKLYQIDPRLVRFVMIIIFGIVAPIVINKPGLPGGVSGL
jgi:hypothetical protein